MHKLKSDYFGYLKLWLMHFFTVIFPFIKKIIKMAECDFKVSPCNHMIIVALVTDL